jgi:hypothetical protein
VYPEGFSRVAGTPFLKALFNFLGDFSQKFGNYHVTTIRLPLSGNLSSDHDV